MAVTAENTAPRSELLSVVAWMLIVGAAFGILSALTLLALAGVLLAYAPPDPASTNSLLGVGLVTLSAAALMLLAGIGLRRRYNWARALTIGLCYLGIFLLIVMFGLQYFAINTMLPRSHEPAQIQMAAMLGLVLKTFLGTVTIAASGLLMWLSNRLSTPAILAEFRPAPKPQPPVTPSKPGETPDF